MYVGTLCRELCDGNRGSDVRQAAGVALKNALVSKDPGRRQEYEERWMAIDASTRTQLKGQLLNTLGAGEFRAGTAAAQATAAIARVELPRNAWPELMEALISSVHSSNENLRRCAIETIGYVCEEIEPVILEKQSDKILTAVITGLSSEEPSAFVRASAAHALLNSLEFARMNFDRPHERDIIMNVVCTATQASDESIVIAAFECLVRIISLYYHLMQAYMDQAVAMLTIKSMRSTNENIALQAIEFWSTVCDIEMDLQAAETSEFECLDFARRNRQQLLPCLLTLLPHEDEDDAGEWNKAMAAGTCLSLLAECVRDDIFHDGLILQFVQENISSTDWRLREAAVMTYGSVMDGPHANVVTTFINEGLPFLLRMMNDSSVAVRDTTAWAIGRVVDFFHEILPKSIIPSIIDTLVVGLQGPPRVATNCCWSLMSLFVHFGDDSNSMPTSIISSHLTTVASALFSTAQRSDADESGLRSAAYQSLANVVLFSPMDCTTDVKKLQDVMIVKLSESLSYANHIVSIEDRMRYSELQSHICAVLQNCLKKLGRPDLHSSDQIMSALLAILRTSAKGSELEDVMLLIGTLVAEIDEEFLRFTEQFIPLLIKAISNHDEYHLCTVSVGVVGDLARALGQNLFPYCDDLMRCLLEALQSPSLPRDIKPHTISAIGDIGMGIGGNFVKYLSHTMTFFRQAAQLTVQDEDDFDEVDFICDLRESLLESYTSIVHGSKGDQQALVALSQYVLQVTELISIIASDVNRSDAMVRAAIGLIGDLVDTYKTQMIPIIRSEWLVNFIQQPMDETSQLSDATISVVRWAQNVVNQVVA